MRRSEEGDVRGRILPQVAATEGGPDTPGQEVAWVPRCHFPHCLPCFVAGSAPREISFGGSQTATATANLDVHQPSVF